MSTRSDVLLCAEHLLASDEIVIRGMYKDGGVFLILVGVALLFGPLLFGWLGIVICILLSILSIILGFRFVVKGNAIGGEHAELIRREDTIIKLQGEHGTTWEDFYI